MDRKEFINKFFRIGILGGILILLGYMVTWRKVTVDKCADNFACASCKKSGNCNLPEKNER